MGDIVQFTGGRDSLDSIGKRVTFFTAYGAISGRVSGIDGSNVTLEEAVIRPAGNIRDRLQMNTVVVQIAQIICYAPYIEDSFHD